MLIIENISKIAGEHIETNGGIYKIYNIVQKKDLYGFTLQHFDTNAFAQLLLSREHNVLYPDHYQLYVNGHSSKHIWIATDTLKDKDMFIGRLAELMDRVYG